MKPSKTSPQVVEEKLSELISRCRVQDKLPTEAELMKEYGVSRSMLREVLKSFEAKGVIVSKQGSGHFVQNPDFVTQLSNCWHTLLNTSPDQLLDLLEIRAILEINCTQTAINCATPEQLKALARQVELMKEKAAQGLPFTEEDRQFHTLIFSSVGNSVMADLLDVFWDLFKQTGIDSHNGDLVKGAEHHEQIFKAITQRDADTVIRLLNKQFADTRYLIVMYLANNKP